LPDVLAWIAATTAIERGEFNVSLDTIVKIAGALEVSAAALLKRAGL
jgi:transcriptional regulator with XRE-family HTH domain